MAGQSVSTDAASVHFEERKRPGRLGSWGTKIWRFARAKPLGAIGAALIILMLILAAIPEIIATDAYDQINLTNRFQSPSLDNFFGTDDQGRDVFSRVVYGARTTIYVSFSAVFIATVFSLIIGMVSGYFAGLVDMIVQRFVDIWQAFPGLVFIIFLVSIFGSGERTLIISAAFLFTAGSSRLIRSQTLVLKELQFVEAARVLGAPDRRIIMRHIMPNVMPIVLVNVSVQIGAVLLIESALSFLGYGVPPPAPSWGRMLREAQRDMQYYPYLAIFPGLAIALTVYGFNVLGDALRDVLDPRLRGSR